MRIVGRPFSIVRDNTETSRVGCLGFIDAGRDIIAIKKRSEDFLEYQETCVLMHEFYHGLDVALGLNLSEEQTNLLAVGTIALVRDNKIDLLNTE